MLVPKSVRHLIDLDGLPYCNLDPGSYLMFSTYAPESCTCIPCLQAYVRKNKKIENVIEKAIYATLFLLAVIYGLAMSC